uniref:Cell cycle checkpoint protein RAD1 n=1 Tax=Clastoptera arizonana TaxID=38151 RepID=A0A1B6D9P5_9HEMI
MDYAVHDKTGLNKTTNNLFKLKMDNVKNLSVILKVLNFKEIATCFVSTNGLKVVVEDSKCIQVSAYISSNVFQELHVKENEQITFRIDLSTMLECLTIFDHCSSVPGLTTALMMSYQYEGAPLKMILEENGIITDCLLKTMNADDILDFHFPTNSEINKIIVLANDFKEIFNDLDTSTDYVELFLSPEPPYFVITTHGLCGECQVNIPQNCDMIELFECKLDTKSSFGQSSN